MQGKDLLCYSILTSPSARLSLSVCCPHTIFKKSPFAEVKDSSDNLAVLLLLLELYQLHEHFVSVCVMAQLLRGA